MGRKPGSPNKPNKTNNTAHLTVLPKQINEIDCGDCGCKYARVVTHTRIENPRYWRHKCNCGRYYNPVTDAWEHTTAMQLNQQIKEANKKVPAE